MDTPYDYTDLMDDVALIATLSELRVFRMSTVARRAALPSPYRTVVETALNAREQFLTALAVSVAGPAAALSVAAHAP